MPVSMFTHNTPSDTRMAHRRHTSSTGSDSSAEPILNLQRWHGNQYVRRMIAEGRLLRTTQYGAPSVQTDKKPAPDENRQGTFKNPILIRSKAKMDEYFDKRNVAEEARIAEPGNIFFEEEGTEIIQTFGPHWAESLNADAKKAAQFLATFGNHPNVTFYKYDPPTLLDELTAAADLLNLNFEKGGEGGSTHGTRGGSASGIDHWGVQMLYVGVTVVGVFFSGGNGAGRAAKKEPGKLKQTYGKAKEFVTGKPRELATMSDAELKKFHENASFLFKQNPLKVNLLDWLGSEWKTINLIADLQDGKINKKMLIDAGLDLPVIKAYRKQTMAILEKIERGTAAGADKGLHQLRLEAMDLAMKIIQY